MDGGISSFFSLSAALFIGTPPPNEAANNPAPSTPEVPWGRSWGPSDPCELTPATLLLLLLRDKIWKLPLLLWRVMLSVESFAEGVSVTWSWPGGCFPVKGTIANKMLLCHLTSIVTQKSCDKLTFTRLSLRTYWLQNWFLCTFLTARLQRSKDGIWTGLHAPKVRRHIEAVQILRLVHEDQVDCAEVPTAYRQGLHIREASIASYSPGDNLEFTRKWRTVCICGLRCNSYY